jgi:hypothetical protein
MNYRFLALLLLVGAAAYAGHSALNEPAVAAGHSAAAKAQGADRTGTRATVETGVSKVTHTIGRGGSMMAGPAVLGMTRRTEQMLANHQSAVQKAPPLRRARAERAGAQITAMNKAAIRHLDAGEPIRAFRTAMEARGLIDVVKQNTLEEAIR